LRRLYTINPLAVVERKKGGLDRCIHVVGICFPEDVPMKDAEGAGLGWGGGGYLVFEERERLVRHAQLVEDVVI